MCATTTHWATHVSTECAIGGTAQCDGFCEEHQDECTCSCHGAWDLPSTVEAVRDWHDEQNDVVASFGTTDTDRLVAQGLAEALAKCVAPKRFTVMTGQNRIIVAEHYPV